MALLSPRFYTVVFALFMSFFMSSLMSGVITIMNTGIGGDFLMRWLRAGLVAWAIAFPLVSFIAPVAHWITRKLVRND